MNYWDFMSCIPESAFDAEGRKMHWRGIFKFPCYEEHMPFQKAMGLLLHKHSP